MTATTETPATDRPAGKATVEQNKRLKALLKRCAETFNANLAIIGRDIKEKCKHCRGEIRTSDCFRCSRVVRTFGILDDIDKVLR